MLLCSWIQYYLSLDSLGPTVGVPVIYAAPASAFKVTHIQPSAAEAAAKAAEASVSSHKDDGDQPVVCVNVLLQDSSAFITCIYYY